MRGDPCIKPFFLLAMAPETTIFNHLTVTKLREIVTRTTISASMKFIVFLAALACGVCCNENLPSQPLLQSKNKRGISDHSVTFPSESSFSYSAPVHSSLSSGYELRGSSGGLSLGHAGLLNSVGHGSGYPLTSSSGLGLGSGYQSSGLSHGSLNPQGISLGGHSAQSTYSVPSIANLGSGGSSNALFTSSKTGPVTFGPHGGGGGAASTSGSSSYSAPIYTSGGHGLSAYNNGGTSSAGLQVVLGSQHGLSLGSPGASSSYNLPVHAASSGSSQTVTGGLIIASGSHGGSPSYSLPTSASSHGISSLSGSSGIHGASSTYALPISSGSHGISALSSSAGSSSYPASSGSYGSSSTHSGISSDDSSYELPIASGSYSNSGSSNAISHINYLPSHSSGSSSSYSSSSYSSPSVSYATPSISHVGSAGSGYPGGGASYSLNSNIVSNHVGSSSSPIVTYTGSRGYTPMYYSSSSSHGTAADSHGAYSSVNPRYLGYGTKFYNVDSGSAKYDTISYSAPNGK